MRTIIVTFETHMGSSAPKQFKGDKADEQSIKYIKKVHDAFCTMLDIMPHGIAQKYFIKLEVNSTTV